MRAYLDSSVVLRLVFGQPEPLREWAAIDSPVTSALTRVECLRTIDRARLVGKLSDSRVAELRSAVLRVLDSTERIEITPTILSLAANPLPTALGTLDALHLATATICRERKRGQQELALATHDHALALAGRALGFNVLGAN